MNMKKFWREIWIGLLIAYLLAVPALGWLIYFTGGHFIAYYLSTVAILVLGVPWSVGFMLIGSELLPRYGAEFIGVLVLPSLGVLINIWLIWRQIRKYKVQEVQVPAAPSDTLSELPIPNSIKVILYPQSKFHGLWWAVIVPCALFISFWYALSLWGPKVGHASIYNLRHVLGYAQVIALLNCWVLFFRWKKNHFFLLGTAVVPVLVMAWSTDIFLLIFPSWFWKLYAFAQDWAINMKLSIADPYEDLLWLVAFCFVYAVSMVVSKLRVSTG